MEKQVINRADMWTHSGFREPAPTEHATRGVMERIGLLRSSSEPADTTFHYRPGWMSTPPMGMNVAGFTSTTSSSSADPAATFFHRPGWTAPTANDREVSGFLSPDPAASFYHRPGLMSSTSNSTEPRASTSYRPPPGWMSSTPTTNAMKVSDFTTNTSSNSAVTGRDSSFNM